MHRSEGQLGTKLRELQDKDIDTIDTEGKGKIRDQLKTKKERTSQEWINRVTWMGERF